MAKQINHFYEFGSVRLDATNRLLYKDGEQLPVQPRVIETLLVLVKNAHAIVDKETILAAVWPDVVVEEGGLKRNISLLRKALGEEGRLIETLPKRGYRFAADVKEDWEEIPAYTVGSATSEMVVERRASLRIMHEEEISDSSDSQAHIPADEKRPRPEPPHQRRVLSATRRHALTVSAAVVAALLAGLGFWWATSKPEAAAPAPIKSIAVLPFNNLASHGDDEHLGIGLADALITRLSSVKGLSVRPTSAVMKFNGKEQDSVAAGLALGVDAVLEGSIYRTDDRVRIMMRLVRVSDHAPLWAGQFDEKANNIFLIQNTVPQQVASSLALNLSPGEKDALTKQYTESADAFQLYVTGRYHWNKRSRDGIAQAETFFRKAIERDPTFALAYVGLADSLTIRGIRDESNTAIKKAIELDGRLGEAYAARGFWNMFKEWGWSDAEADFKQAIDLNPGYGTAHQWYATLLAITGRVEEAKSEMRRALDIDPTSHNFLADLGQMHYFAREYDEAESYCRKALDIYSDFVFARVYLITIYLKKGEDDKAFEEEINIARANHISSGDSEDVVARHITGLREEYRRSGYKWWLRLSNERLLNRNADYFSFYGLAKNYALLGEKEHALDALEKSYENRDFMLPFVNVDPIYDGLRSEPRFQAVMRRMGLRD
jgi:TolB-like protein/DNA-binding winged helix-turn-helix (wHTH) protein/Tfp pilus assembly protein PilF